MAQDNVERRILVIGCSDGIGLELVRRLLEAGWRVVGVSRRDSPLRHPSYRHQVRDVAAAGFRGWLSELVAQTGPFTACVYCAGIGEGFEPNHLETDLRVFQVNLLAAVETAAVLLPRMVQRRNGHILVLSSQVDRLRLVNSPAYAASKAGLSSYFESMAPAVRKLGVKVTNLRFGFIDTKMAKSPVKPFLRSTAWAVEVILHALEKKPVRVTRPRRTACLVALLGWLDNCRLWLALNKR